MSPFFLCHCNGAVGLTAPPQSIEYDWPIQISKLRKLFPLELRQRGLRVTPSEQHQCVPKMDQRSGRIKLDDLACGHLRVIQGPTHILP